MGGDWRQALADIGADDGLSALPAACYGAEDVFVAESACIFGQSWVFVGRLDRWRSPGDYACIDFAGTSAIVIMERTGQLAAFVNACRHRGARLLDGDGNCQAIRCPLHRWTYGLDGDLLVANQMQRTAGFGKAAIALMRLPIASQDGFVFINPDGQAGELHEWLGDFCVRHTPWQLAELRTTRRRELLVECNWKLFLEIFNDYYHLPYVHPRSLQGLYQEPELADGVRGAYASHFGTNEGTGGLLAEDQAQALPLMAGLTGKLARGTRYTWVFPNLSFAASREAIWIYEVYPTDARRTQVVMTAAFPEATMQSANFEARAEHYYARLDVALDEDLEALANQQRGITARGARTSRCSWLEANLGAFARWYARRLTAA